MTRGFTHGTTTDLNSVTSDGNLLDYGVIKKNLCMFNRDLDDTFFVFSCGFEMNFGHGMNWCTNRMLSPAEKGRSPSVQKSQVLVMYAVIGIT